MDHDTYLMLERVEKKLDALTLIASQLWAEVKLTRDSLTLIGANIMQELDALQAQVTAIAGVEDSAIALLNGLSQRLIAAAADPAQVNAIAQALGAKSAELAAAVVANTPAE